MKNVIAYTRVSTDGQCGDDRFGLQVQKEMIQEYCDYHDMKITYWVSDEGESGAKERPGFDSIIYDDAIGNPPFEAVVVAKSDRVARDINLYYYYKMLLTKKGVSLISISEDFGQMGIMAPILEAFIVSVAQIERDNIKARTTAGRFAKARVGGYSGGKAPLGYKVHEGKLVIVPKEAALVRRIFELKEDGGTLRSICDIVAREGYVSRSGKEVNFGTIRKVLGNEMTYRGYYKYGKDSNWVKGKHEAILK